MNVGLFFGTFNPIHVGHLIIANYMSQHSDLDQVWIVVSPLNPLKNKTSLLPDFQRLNLVRLAIEDNPKLKVSDIEFSLPIPSFTVNTLAYLKEKHPSFTFSLILGEDNLRNFHKWFNFEYIISNHKIFVFPRSLTELETIAENDSVQNEIKSHKNIELCNEIPLMKISSSYIREAIKNGKDMRYLLTEPVLKYVDEMNFYKKV